MDFNIKQSTTASFNFVPPDLNLIDPGLLAPLNKEPLEVKSQPSYRTQRTDFEVNHRVGILGADGDFRVAQSYPNEKFIVVRNNYEKGIRIPRPWFSPTDPQLLQIADELYFYDPEGVVYSEDAKGMVWRHCEFRVVAKEKVFSLQNHNVRTFNNEDREAAL